jgi:hypothetical protein
VSRKSQVVSDEKQVGCAGKLMPSMEGRSKVGFELKTMGWVVE